MIKDEFGNRRFYGVYRGTVSNTNDPLGKYRAKLVVPQVFGNEVTGWAWNATPYIEVSTGQGVFVLFEGGDPAYPIFFGVFGKDVPIIPFVDVDPYVPL